MGCHLAIHCTSHTAVVWIQCYSWPMSEIALFRRRTMHFDNVKIPFHQQMYFLLNVQNVKIYIKISYIRSYMFRSVWTNLRELTLSLANVTLL
jgi:hypothetical protein